jgi:hypothetical protein
MGNAVNPRRILPALLLLASSLAAEAQNFGNIPPQTVLGNSSTTATKPATPVPFTALGGGAGTCTALGGDVNGSCAANQVTNLAHVTNGSLQGSGIAPGVLGTMAPQNANAVNITGGTINLGTGSFANIDNGSSSGTGGGINVNQFGAIHTTLTNHLANSTLALLVSSSATGTLPAGSQGNFMFGMFGECFNKGISGQCVGAEFTTRNATGTPGDTNLPPVGPVSAIGENVTCGITPTSNADCSTGVQITNESGSYSDFAFFTGLYVGIYRPYGIVVNALPSGTQVGALLETNGSGPALQLTDTNAANGNYNLLVTSPGGTVAGITNSGHFLTSQLIATGHGAAPTISSCGTGPTLGTNATDTSGYVAAGSGTTACTITFGTPFLVAPACVVTGDNAGNVILSAQTAALITVSSASLASETFNYICLPQGG